MPKDDALPEARRVLGVCNVCGYCNGFCDTFESAKRRPALADTDLAQLANLCHACRNCLHACQYAPPHPFTVNVPRALAQARHRLYGDYAWPRALSALFERSVPTVFLTCLISIALLLGLVLVTAPSSSLFAPQQGAGAFYRFVPWWGMLLIGVLPLGWSVLAIGMSLRNYWQATKPDAKVSSRALWSALRDVLVLRNLRGGGPGCNDLDDRPSRQRRWFHQTLLLGVLLSFAATLVATVYHHVLGLQAPYPLSSLPVILGTLGGLAMVIATLGLGQLAWRGDRAPTAPDMRAADTALTTLLFLVAASGLALLAWRATAVMGVLLVLHLGTVLACFILLPYSKFVHAGYRFLALLIEAIEQAPRH